MADPSQDAAAEGDKNQAAFLLLIRWAEFYPHGGTPGDYNLMYGGGMFTDMKDHPRKVVTRWGHSSSAAGAYMILPVTWDEYKKKLGLADFSKSSQDRVAIAIIETSGALGLVREGKIEDAIKKLRGRWTSLPGAAQQQGGVTMVAALAQFKKYRGDK